MNKNVVHGGYDQWSMVVVYDPKTGEIAYSHEVITVRGGTHPDKPGIETLVADQLAQRSKISVEKMAFLHVDPREIDLDVHYVVDVASKTLKPKA
jgi:hypothetical protein